MIIAKPTIGFIGQGYIGKNYADDFVNRGYSVVRYALEEPFVENKEKVGLCDIVFIAVPTPTTPEGFSADIVQSAVGLVKPGGIAVVKSTILPGSTRRIQGAHPGVIVLNSPEFLSEASAAHDAANPPQNIIGIPEDTDRYREAAQLVLSVLPKAPSELICKSEEAEMFKYVHNINGYIQIVMFNLLYDLSSGLGADWGVVKQAISADPFMRAIYANPVHKTGRGAGGHCFIKDFAALKGVYKDIVPDALGLDILDALERKNNTLLLESKKDLDLLEGVYGANIPKGK
jgi:UDPglucose 6-dehydrogenase